MLKEKMFKICKVVNIEDAGRKVFLPLNTIKELQNELNSINCPLLVGYDSWCYIYYIDGDRNNGISILEYDVNSKEYSLNRKNLRYVRQLEETEQLKEKAKELKIANETIKNRKAEKLLKLALNKACSFGELRNCITIVINIFKATTANNISYKLTVLN